MDIAVNIKKIKKHIRVCEKKYNREAGSVKLLAVSKGQDVGKITAAIEAQQFCFGENYLQEALEKIAYFNQLSIEWHFIGSIQSNKTKDIAENFSWVHSIDREKIAQRLHEQRPAHLVPLNVCVEVNMDNESNKSGVNINEVKMLVEKITPLHRLRFRGLMVIPRVQENKLAPLEAFEKVAVLAQQLRQVGFPVDTLSMGMSADYEMAIAAGSTLVRVGTALFGRRGTL